jgi:type I restriction enzyme S subunit
MSKLELKSFADAPIEIIDGDRGVNYPQKSDFFEDGYCLFLNTGNVTDKGFSFSSASFITAEKDSKLRKGKLKRGDIVLTTRGTVGNVAYYDASVPYENVRINSGMVILRVTSPEIFPYYLYLFLRSNLFKTQVLSHGSGSAQPQLPIGSLRNIVIPWHDKLRQNKIASVLSGLDSKISLNNRINAELEAMAKTLYDYWFVQFDFPNKNGKPYKASGGKMVWNEELKREIPEGWRAGTLSEISDIVRGVSYSANDIKDKNERVVVPILRATNISGNVIDLQNMVYVPGEFVSDKQVLNKFDILITMSSGSKDHIGKNGFYYFDEHVAFGAFCAKLVAKVNYRYYLYSYTQSDFMFTTIKNESLGTNINNLNGTMVAGFKLVIPPKELIKKFNFKVESVFEKIGLNIRENQKLTELRDWLLPMLMNGQIKIKDAESELAMAAEPEVSYRKLKKL